VSTVAIVLKPLECGWAVALTDGRELARFTGPFARCRAERHVADVLGAVRRAR
jgi:hypothetical protein